MRGRTQTGKDGGRARRWQFLSAALVALVLAPASAGVLVGAGPAGATGNGLFSVTPTSPKGGSVRAYFTPVLSPGVSARDAVTVANMTAKTMKLKVYAADAYSAKTGGFAIQSTYKPKLHMGAWIHLPVSTVTVAPQHADIIPFSYTPPPNVGPGDYAGGIVAVQQTVKYPTKGHVHVRALQAIGVAVMGSVPGPLHPKLTVTAVSLTTTRPFASQFGGAVNATVTYSVTNTGNENLKPAVTVSLSPLIGGGPASYHVQLPQVLPGSTVTFHHTFDHVVPYGSLTATVTAKASGITASGSSTAVIIPWGIVGIVVLLILLVIVIVRRRRRSRPGPQTDHAEPGSAPPGNGGATPPVSAGTGPGARGP